MWNQMMTRCGCPNRRREELLDSCCRVPLLINPCLPPLEVDPELDECPTESPSVLGGRYYIKVHYPAASPFVEPMKVYLPPTGITEGLLQLLLPPSTRRGINGHYKVEYWKYYPYINPLPRTRIMEQLIKRELWSIPFIDPMREGHIDMVRSDRLSSSDDLDIIQPSPLGVLAFDVISIGSPHWEGSSLRYFPFPSLPSYKEKAPPISHVGIGWGQAQPRPGSLYRVRYMRPYSWEDVVVG
jgi:hypothetical protein